MKNLGFRGIGLNSLECCGILELNGIAGSSPRTCLSTIVEEYAHDYSDWTQNQSFTTRIFLRNCHPFFIFSDSRRGAKSGRALACFIRRKRLGKVWASDTKDNPTGSPGLKMWMYQVDKKALVKWYEKGAK